MPPGPSTVVIKSPSVDMGSSGTASPRRLSGASTIPETSPTLKPPPGSVGPRSHISSMLLSGSMLLNQQPPPEFVSTACQTDQQIEDALGGYVPRSSYVRLQQALREERGTYTREVLALQQAIARLEALHKQQSSANQGSMNATHRASSPSTTPTANTAATQQARAAAADAVTRAVSHVEILSKTVTMFDLANDLAKEKELAVAAMRFELDSAARVAIAAVAQREAELKVEVNRLQRDVAAMKNVHAVKINRIQRQAEEAAAQYTQDVMSDCSALRAQVADLTLQLSTCKAELASSQAQNAQYTLQLSRVQQQVSEGIHERAAMKLALEEAASAFETFAAQQQDFVKYQARVNAQAEKAAGYRRESVAYSTRRGSVMPGSAYDGLGDSTYAPSALTPRAPQPPSALNALLTGPPTLTVKAPSSVSPRAAVTMNNIRRKASDGPAWGSVPTAHSAPAALATSTNLSTTAAIDVMGMSDSTDDTPASLMSTARGAGIAQMIQQQQQLANNRSTPNRAAAAAAAYPFRDDLLSATAPPT